MESSNEFNKDKKEDDGVEKREPTVNEHNDKENKEETIEEHTRDKHEESIKEPSFENKQEAMQTEKEEETKEEPKVESSGEPCVGLSNNTTTSNFSEIANHTHFQFTDMCSQSDVGRSNNRCATPEPSKIDDTLKNVACSSNPSQRKEGNSEEQTTPRNCIIQQYLESHIETLKTKEEHINQFDRCLRICLEKGLLKEKCRRNFAERNYKLLFDEERRIIGDFSKESMSKKINKSVMSEEEKARRNKILQDAFAECFLPYIDVWKDVEYTKVEYVKLIDEEDLCNLMEMEHKESSSSLFSSSSSAQQEEPQHCMNKKKHCREELHTMEDCCGNEYCKHENERKLNDKEAGDMVISPVDKAFVQTPLKCILNTFRLFQKDLERHITVITLFVEKKIDLLSDDEALEKLNTIIEKLESLKKKVAEIKTVLNKCVRRLYNRLKTIHCEMDIEMESLKRDFQVDIFAHRYNWLIDEFLSRNGFFESEEVFRQRYNLESYTDVDVYKEYLYIMTELKKHNTEPALSWSQKYKSQIKKLDMNIEAELHLQHVINLVVDKKHGAAINYIKKNVTKPWGSISVDIRYIITHIGLNSSANVFNAFITKRWKKVIKLFNKVYTEITGIPPRSTLELLLKAGISTIKSNSCAEGRSSKCPTCIRELQDVVPLLPSISKTRSFIVCPYTGELMDENNPPFTIPSGKVYSEKCIMSHIDEAANFICPDSKEEVPVSKISRLFI